MAGIICTTSGRDKYWCSQIGGRAPDDIPNLFNLKIIFFNILNKNHNIWKMLYIVSFIVDRVIRQS